MPSATWTTKSQVFFVFGGQWRHIDGRLGKIQRFFVADLPALGPGVGDLQIGPLGHHLFHFRPDLAVVDEDGLPRLQVLEHFRDAAAEHDVAPVFRRVVRDGAPHQEYLLTGKHFSVVEPQQHGLNPHLGACQVHEHLTVAACFLFRLAHEINHGFPQCWIVVGTVDPHAVRSCRYQLVDQDSAVLGCFRGQGDHDPGACFAGAEQTAGTVGQHGVAVEESLGRRVGKTFVCRHAADPPQRGHNGIQVRHGPGLAPAQRRKPQG